MTVLLQTRVSFELWHCEVMGIFQLHFPLMPPCPVCVLLLTEMSLCRMWQNILEAHICKVRNNLKIKYISWKCSLEKELNESPWSIWKCSQFIGPFEFGNCVCFLPKNVLEPTSNWKLYQYLMRWDFRWRILSMIFQSLILESYGKCWKQCVFTCLPHIETEITLVVTSSYWLRVPAEMVFGALSPAFTVSVQRGRPVSVCTGHPVGWLLLPWLANGSRGVCWTN